MYCVLAFPGGSDGKESACSASDLGWEDPPEKGMATHPSILAWRVPRTEKPGRLQFMGSQRVRHNSTTTLLLLLMFCYHITTLYN